MKDILGVVLCGGESKRMGTDKGLMPVAGTIRAKFMADKLSAQGLQVIFSINNNQLKDYSHQLPQVRLVVDNSGIKGPAGGMLTVHRNFPASDILLVACDMLELDAATINNLINEYLNERSYDYYVYEDERFTQPLCGIYTARGLDKLEAYISVASLTGISMQHILNSGITRRIRIANTNVFNNYNSPDQ